jgi:hypothetical protein
MYGLANDLADDMDFPVTQQPASLARCLKNPCEPHGTVDLAKPSSLPPSHAAMTTFLGLDLGKSKSPACPSGLEHFGGPLPDITADPGTARIAEKHGVLECV